MAAIAVARRRGRPQNPQTIIPPADVVDTAVLMDLKVNARFIHTQLTTDYETTRDWLARHRLLANSVTCQGCQQPMRLTKKAELVLDGEHWRCRDCSMTQSIRKGSFFEKSHLSLMELLELIYWWTTDNSQVAIMLEVECSHTTLIDWFMFCRDICVEWIFNHSVPIGGVDPVTGAPLTVEIDESLFFKMKHNRGAPRPQKWILGGVERVSKKCFMVEVDRRDADTLMPIIQQWVLPGSRVITDQWGAYMGAQGFPANPQYTHVSVNHTLHFVDPNDRTIHTNTVEGFWSHSKQKFRKMRGTCDAHFDSYLAEFMFRYMHVDRATWFGVILYWITHQ
uniref:ISXO2-like transposase domain-containing protein n=1 Tax=Plectus sambesii TaxID=2011161 RepID=A0A914VW32_9BILA